MGFEPDQAIDVVFFGEAGSEGGFVLGNAAGKIALVTPV
jgi:hypothetical protein